MNLYVFNPEHDYALANNDENFVAPQSAIQFAKDCACLPNYYAEDNGIIFQPYSALTFTSLNDVIVNCTNEKITHISPWGWNKSIIHKLIDSGIDSRLLPDKSQMNKIRDLAHRKTASLAMQYIIEHCDFAAVLPHPADMLTDINMINKFAKNHGEVILKSPYSSNGRGHILVHNALTPTIASQCEKVLYKHGMLLGEPLYNVLINFAMEFFCDSMHHANFYSYSLFDTKNFGYMNNILDSDNEILNNISQWIDIGIIEATKQLLLEFIQSYIAPYYSGYLGVDMFIYDNDRIKLNPAVEINLRMTMGVVARAIYNCHIQNGSKGIMNIEFRENDGKLLEYVEMMKDKFPLVCDNGRWGSGFASLCPVNTDTHYGVALRVKSEKLYHNQF